jgi:trimeric autotransporter adhesin
MSNASRLNWVVGVGGLLLMGVGTTEAAQRTFVATTGFDTNPCTLTAPCRGFLAAYAQTDANGEIVVLESGGYGGLTIGKSVTVTSPAGVYAGVSVLTGDGIVVGSGAAKVVLRGLAINGLGGNNGIRIQAGAGEVHVENLVVSNMAQAGISVEGGTSVRLSGVTSRSNGTGLTVAPTASLAVVVRDSEFSNNIGAGVEVAAAGSGVVARVTAERTSATKNGAGFAASAAGGATARLVVVQSVAAENAGGGVSSTGAGATVFVRETAASDNGTGLLQASSGVLNACGSNLLVANGTAQVGTINVNASACLDQVAGGGTGTVTSLSQGSGIALSSNPITTTGTIGLATTQLLPTAACAANQVPQWTGSAWACASVGGTGTVTSVATGAGLAGGPITGSGTVDLRLSAAGGLSKALGAGSNELGIAGGGVTSAMMASNGCTTGQILKFNGATWGCAADAVGSGGGADAFVNGGNSFPSQAVLGTNNVVPLQIFVNGAEAMRLEPGGAPYPDSPRIVGGGGQNSASDSGGTVSGGGRGGNNCDNSVTGAPTASCANVATGPYATIGGGLANSANSASTIAGGESNAAVGAGSTVAGGYRNRAGGLQGTVAGGRQNTAEQDFAAIAGGRENNAVSYAHVGGGFQNDASGPYSVIGGGSMNRTDDAINGSFATIAGGALNVAAGLNSTIGGGENNSASGNHATIPGGRENVAAAADSFASGYGARALAAHAGSHVFADSTAGTLSTNAANEFVVAAAGGIWLMTNKAREVGCWIVGGNLGCTSNITGNQQIPSDRALKTGVAAVAPQDILDRVAALPIASWEYKNAPGVRHVGPMAQDFHAAFGLGDSDRTIGVVDASGVALAAIQGLNAKLEATVAEQAREIADLRDRLAQVESLRGDLAAIRATLAATLPARTTLAATAR